MYQQGSATIWPGGYTHLVVAVWTLLLALWGSRLRRAIGPVLLSLPLRIVWILSWGTLGGAYKKDHVQHHIKLSVNKAVSTCAWVFIKKMHFLGLVFLNNLAHMQPHMQTVKHTPNQEVEI